MFSWFMKNNFEIPEPPAIDFDLARKIKATFYDPNHYYLPEELLEDIRNVKMSDLSHVSNSTSSDSSDECECFDNVVLNDRREANDDEKHEKHFTSLSTSNSLPPSPRPSMIVRSNSQPNFKSKYDQVPNVSESNFSFSFTPSDNFAVKNPDVSNISYSYDFPEKFDFDNFTSFETDRCNCNCGSNCSCGPDCNCQNKDQEISNCNIPQENKEQEKEKEDEYLLEKHPYTVGKYDESEYDIEMQLPMRGYVFSIEENRPREVNIVQEEIKKEEIPVIDWESKLKEWDIDAWSEPPAMVKEFEVVVENPLYNPSSFSSTFPQNPENKLSQELSNGLWEQRYELFESDGWTTLTENGLNTLSNISKSNYEILEDLDFGCSSETTVLEKEIENDELKYRTEVRKMKAERMRKLERANKKRVISRKMEQRNQKVKKQIKNLERDTIAKKVKKEERNENEKEIEKRKEEKKEQEKGQEMEKKKEGYLELFIGPMFSGKSSRLLFTLTTMADQRFQCLYVNSVKDVRTTEAQDEIATTHNSSYSKMSPKITCMKADNLDEIDVTKFSHIGIDEFQFFSEPCVQTVVQWVAQGKHVYVSSLDGDSYRRKFGFVLDLIPHANKVNKLYAFCDMCRDTYNITKEAPFTARMTSDTTATLVGGKDLYKAMCRSCHDFHLSL